MSVFLVKIYFILLEISVNVFKHSHANVKREVQRCLLLLMYEHKASSPTNVSPRGCVENDAVMG